MFEKKNVGDHTKCVRSLHGPKDFDGSVITPIFQTSNFRFSKSQELIDYQEGRGHAYMYTRYGNPTAEEVEKRLADLERGEKALLFASGMAATASTCLAFLNAGDRLLASRSLYGGTINLFETILKRFGVQVNYIALEEPSRLPEFLHEPAKLLWFETPVNPTLQVLDIAAIVQAARAKGVLTVCDNTFATPINQKPLELGVDMVMHSLTKYIGGHSDLLGGAVIGSVENIKKLSQVRKYTGGVADPHLAFLAGRGLKTVAVRMERHNATAQKVAEFLKGHPLVTRTFYPGLTGSPDYAIARRQMTGFGGMVCFEIKGNLKDAMRVADSFEIILNATSLGGVESLASLPALTSQYGLSPQERAKAGISDGMIRLSVGLEDAEDLIADLDQALRA